MNLIIDVEKNKDQHTVYVTGEIDIYTAPKLKEELLHLTEKNGQTIIVDLNGVHYMDSTGLGVFISAVKATNENQSHLKMINLQERVLRLFNITGLNEIMDIHPTGRGVN